MAPGNPFVYVVHSIAEFNHPLRQPSHLHSKAIGFLGNRAEFTFPEPVLFPPDVWTDQQVDIINDTLLWVTFCDDVANRLRFFAAAEGAITKRIQLPYLLHLPHVLVSFIIT